MDTPYERAQRAESFSHLADAIAVAVADRIGTAPHPEPAEESNLLPRREWLTVQEAVEWTGLSKSSIMRARRRGLPSSKALGRTVLHIGDLRELMRGRYN